MDVPCLKALLVEKGALKASGQHRSAPESNLIGMSVVLDDGGVLFTAYNLRPMLERIRTIPLVVGAGLFVVLLFSLVVSRHFSLRSLRAAASGSVPRCTATAPVSSTFVCRSQRAMTISIA